MIEAIVKLSGSIFIAGLGLIMFVIGVIALVVITYTIIDYIKSNY